MDHAVCIFNPFLNTFMLILFMSEHGTIAKTTANHLNLKQHSGPIRS